MAALSPMGFELHRLAGASLADQIQMFAEAELVVGPDGSAYSNLLYARRSGLFELFAHHRVQPHYRRMLTGLTEAGRAIRYYNLPGNSPTRDGDFVVDVPAVTARVERALAEGAAP
jgi:capsular polysaccharide biosynthesis protein